MTHHASTVPRRAKGALLALRIGLVHRPWLMRLLELHGMITCYLRYQVDPDKLAEFEAYAAMWLDLMPRFGGLHHGYFLPSEGESDVALAMFSFPSLATYEQYRKDAGADPDVAKAVAFAKQTHCFIRYERSFFRPLLPKAA